MNMPERISAVGDLERADHSYLPATAQCFYWGEYTPKRHIDGPVWEYSATNKLITNYKKKPLANGQQHKQAAIQSVARKFATTWQWADLNQTHRPALIPMPPSKSRTDAMFDPRMLLTLEAMRQHVTVPLDIRDCLSFSGQFAASHESDDRPNPDALFNSISFDAVAGRPDQRPGVLFLFDDMLTTGAHYVAASRRLAEAFPGVPILGTFIARRRNPNPFEDFTAL